MVNEIKTHKGKVNYVVTRSNGIIYTNNIVICTGTFFVWKSVCVVCVCVCQGRIGEESVEKLSKSFEEFGFNLCVCVCVCVCESMCDSVNYNVWRNNLECVCVHCSQVCVCVIRDNKIKDIMFHVEHSELIPWIPVCNQVCVLFVCVCKNTHQIIHDNLNKSQCIVD